jgi:hypothetical protein
MAEAAKIPNPFKIINMIGVYLALGNLARRKAIIAD